MVLVSIATVLLLNLAQLAQSIQLPAGYDTIWTTQSLNSAGSMPLGGGDVGLNVWAESGTSRSLDLAILLSYLPRVFICFNIRSRRHIVLYCEKWCIRREQFSSEIGSRSTSHEP